MVGHSLSCWSTLIIVSSICNPWSEGMADTIGQPNQSSLSKCRAGVIKFVTAASTGSQLPGSVSSSLHHP